MKLMRAINSALRSATKKPMILAMAMGVAASATLSGCAMERNVDNMDKSTASMAAELKGYEEYVKVLTENMTLLTQQITILTKSVLELQQMSKDAFALFVTRMQPAPPALVPPIDELNEAPETAKKP